MKNIALFLASVLIFTGCSDLTSKIVDLHTLKYTAGQRVTVKSYFYSKCYGRVLSYEPVIYYMSNEDVPQNRYNVSLSCNIGQNVQVTLNEDELLPAGE